MQWNRVALEQEVKDRYIKQLPATYLLLATDFSFDILIQILRFELA